MDNLEHIKEQASQRVKVIKTLEEYDNVRVEYLGKQGIVTAQMKTLGSLPDAERKDFGAKLNELKQYITNQLELKKAQLDEAHINEKLASEKIDITLPGRLSQSGKIHPISQVIDELTCIFGTMGFSVIGGPEIEDDYHNFTALNIPDNHPARQMHDTFYLPENEEGKKMLLRTHTSSVQIRLMETEKPPFRVIVPGRTYRCDFDMTHTPMFHQVEGLVIEKNINMGHLKWCIMEFLKKFFEIDNLPVRFRANFFPFTEPSAEVDIGCLRQDGELKIGAGNDWLEILGCGMVHPNVLRNVGINPDQYQGFAFGMGIERIAMLKYGIADLRTFFEGDIRWLNHYGFSAFDIPSLVGGLSR